VNELDTLYLERWAARIVEALGIETLRALNRQQGRQQVAAALAALDAQPEEVDVVNRHINTIIRDNAAPADTPPARGSARMYR
jgi:hypothetical protein